MNIVLLGAPGAGKGTLAKNLCTKLNNYKIMAPGELYRKEANLKTEFGLRAMSYLGDGNLCPDEMTNELMHNMILLNHQDSLIFDGYPRRRSQAEFLDTQCWIDLVLDLYVCEEVAVDRIMSRKDVENRHDDTKEIIVQRFAVYDKNNKEIVDYYKSCANLVYHSIDAEGTKEETLNRALKIIEEKENGIYD
jgi:adenylate kinase